MSSGARLSYADIDAAMTRALDEIRESLEREYLTGPCPFSSHEQRAMYFASDDDTRDLMCRVEATVEGVDRGRLIAKVWD